MKVMPKVLVFALLLLVSFSGQAKVSVEYRISRIQGLFDFAMTISGEPHHALALNEAFIRSPYNTPALQKSIDQIKSIQASLYKSYEYETGAKSRYSGQSVDRLFVIQSIYAKDLIDFSTRTLGLLPTADHLVLFSELKKLEPVYEKLIWKPLSPGLKKHKAQLEALAKKINLNDMFDRAQKFYGATWPPESPFVVAIYPIPFLKNFQNASSSTSIGSVEIHGVIVTGKVDSPKSLAGSFGVIFHELCHSVYAAQTDAFKMELEGYFLNHPSPYAPQAYTWLNEALATAVGNAWAYSKAFDGQLDKEDWYNNPTISGYAKAIYPTVNEALNKNSTLNKDMVDQFVHLYEKTFPNALYSFDSLFNRLLLLYDGNEIAFLEMRRVLRDKFTINSLSSGGGFADKQNISDLRNAKEDSALIILTSKNQTKLNSMAEEVPLIKSNLADILKMKNREILSTLGERGRAFIFIKAENIKDFKEAIDFMAKKQAIDPKNKIWQY